MTEQIKLNRESKLLYDLIDNLMHYNDEVVAFDNPCLKCLVQSTCSIKISNEVKEFIDDCTSLVNEEFTLGVFIEFGNKILSTRKSTMAEILNDAIKCNKLNYYISCKKVIGLIKMIKYYKSPDTEYCLEETNVGELILNIIRTLDEYDNFRELYMKSIEV